MQIDDWWLKNTHVNTLISVRSIMGFTQSGSSQRSHILVFWLFIKSRRKYIKIQKEGKQTASFDFDLTCFFSKSSPTQWIKFRVVSQPLQFSLPFSVCAAPRYYLPPNPPMHTHTHAPRTHIQVSPFLAYSYVFKVIACGSGRVCIRTCHRQSAGMSGSHVPEPNPNARAKWTKGLRSCSGGCGGKTYNMLAFKGEVHYFSPSTLALTALAAAPPPLNSTETCSNTVSNLSGAQESNSHPEEICYNQVHGWNVFILLGVSFNWQTHFVLNLRRFSTCLASF